MIMIKSTIIKPLIHPPCLPDEFPTGYLIRLADINKYRSIFWLIDGDAMQRNVKNVKNYHEMLELSDWAGYENNQFINFENLHSKYFDMQHMRFCPLCIKDSPYIRIGWQLRPSYTCRTHKLWLRDSCAKCRSRVTFSNPNLTDCRCGHPLSDQELLKASEDMIQLQEFIDGDHVINKEFEFDLEKRLAVIIFFNRWLRIRGQYTGLENGKYARDTLGDAAEAIFGGKLGFFNFLNRLQAEDGRAASLTGFRNELYTRFPGNELSYYKSLMEEYINQNWERPLTRRNIHFSQKTLYEHPWIAFAAACREYDISKTVLRKAFLNGYVRFKKETKNKRTLIYLYKQDIGDRYLRIKDIITLKEARLVLGLGKENFTTLVNHKLFKTSLSPAESGLGTWCFSLEEMYSFRDQLTRAVRSTPGASWSFTEVMKYFSGRLDDFLIRLTESVKDGSLSISSLDSDKNGYSSLNFLKSDFLFWLEFNKKNEEYISVPLLAKVLGVQQEFAYELVRRGIINSNTCIDSQNVRISQSQLSDFNNKYVILSKLSKAVGINSRTLISYLASRAIIPIDDDTEKPLRQKVYLEEQLRNVCILSPYLERLNGVKAGADSTPLESGNEKGYLSDASVFRAEGILQDVNQYNDVNMTRYLE